MLKKMLRGSAARFIRLDAMAMNNLFYTLNILKVPELKVLCEHLKLHKTGIKRDLIERLVEAVRRNPHFYRPVLTYVTRRELVSPIAPTPRNPPTIEEDNNYYNPRHTLRRPDQGHVVVQPQNTSVSEDALKVARGFLEDFVNSEVFAERVETVLSAAIFKMPLMSMAFDVTEKQISLMRNGLVCRFNSLELTNKMNKDELENCWPTNATLIVNASQVMLRQRIYQDGKLKNKSVKERPADIQTHLRAGKNYFKLTGQPNMEQGDWPYGICITVARERTIKEVMDIIQRENTISVEDSISRIKEIYSEENDVVTEKMSVSVKCPLTLQRLQIPARGRYCTHLSCFELQDFLKYNQESKNAGFRCIVCHNGPLTLQTIVIDTWFEDVLKKFSHIENLDHIDVLPDGNVQVVQEEELATKDSSRDGDGFLDENTLNPLKRQRVNSGEFNQPGEAPFQQHMMSSSDIQDDRPRAFSTGSDELAGIDFLTKGNSIDNAIEL